MEALPYRIIFEQLHNGHPWNALENDEFLMKLRAVAKNKKGSLYPTTAGLLFFGEAYHITDVFPNYFFCFSAFSCYGSVDYRTGNLSSFYR